MKPLSPETTKKLSVFHKSGKHNIRTFYSYAKLTPFAPEWFYFVSQIKIDGVDFNKVAQIILAKEKQILNEFSYNPVSIDAYTGLGKDSLTSRWQKFNVFKWEEEEIQKLKAEVHKNYLSFIKQVEVPRKKAYIQCWANVLRKGQEIKKHLHSIHEYNYLSGHITVQAEGTCTIYVNPYSVVPIDRAHPHHIYRQPNIPGTLSFFPTCIPHLTSVHNGDQERISIAFDITFLNIKDDQTTDDNVILFDDPTNEN